MGFIVKTFLEIFGGKASTIFALVVLVPMIGTAIWKWNAWLDSRDEAAITKVMYAQEQQTTAALSNHINKQSVLAEKDQKAYTNLTLVNEALQSAKEQAILELNKAVYNAKDGTCNGSDFVPSRELWVLEALARELTKPESLYGGCAGAATGCAASRLRDAIEGRITEAAYNRKSEVRGSGNGIDKVTRELSEMRSKQRNDEALETATNGTDEKD